MTRSFLVTVTVAAVAAVALAACDQSGQDAGPSSVEPAPAPKPATRKKAGDDDRYATKSPEAKATVGAPSSVEFRIEPRGDLKINKEFPWKIEFAAVEGVEFKSAKLDKSAMKLSDSAATIPVELTAANEGTTKLQATGNFSVCNPERCDILRDEPLEFTVVAVAGEGDPASDETTEDSAEASADGETN